MSENKQCFDKEFIDEFCQKLSRCVKECGGVYNNDIEQLGIKMIKTFEGHKFVDYVLDYGEIYNAINIYVYFDDDLFFFIRCEEGDEEEDLIEFSIHRCYGKDNRMSKYTLYSSFDKLTLFKQHVDEFFMLRQKYSDKIK